VRGQAARQRVSASAQVVAVPAAQPGSQDELHVVSIASHPALQFVRFVVQLDEQLAHEARQASRSAPAGSMSSQLAWQSVTLPHPEVQKL
jgi:hypothetical protein